MNKVYVNKIKNYGLHRNDILIQNPDQNSGNTEHYLGERYISDLKNDNENNNDIKQVLISSNTGTIFDKSSAKVFEYEKDDSGNIITNTDGSPKEIIKNNKQINENDNFGDDNTQLYSNFDPTNTKSGLYTEIFEQNSTNDSGSTKQSIVEIKNNKFTTNLSARNKPELNNKILTDRNATANVDDLLHSGNTIGNNPWEGEGDFNAIMTSVDKQDEILLDDIDGKSNNEKLGSAIGNSAKNLITNNIGVVKDTRRLFDKDDKTSRHPKGTLIDEKFDLLREAKNKSYKNIKMSSKLGTYNSLYNLLGSASGMFVGSMGKSALSNIADDMTKKFTGGFGIAGMIERLDGMVESMPSAEEIVALNLANYYNMYTAKPGRIVTDRYRKYNYITPNTDDNLDGSAIGSSKNKFLDGVKKATNTLNKGINIASSWADGSKIAGLVGKITNKKGQINDFEGKCTIISIKRDEYRTEVKGDLFPVSSGHFKINDRSRFASSDIFSNSSNNDNLLGGIYVEPYYNPDISIPELNNNGGLSVYNIPFQFNPVINDGGYEAKYSLEELMGRILQIRSYVGTNSNTVTIETKYFATSPDKIDGKLGSEPQNTVNDEWLKMWTPSVLYKIENMYRKLVLPYINKNVFVRPPIVRIKLGTLGSNNDSGDVNKLFSYHNTDNRFEVTKTLDEATCDKRYIVTNLIINPINQEGFDYYINYNNKSNFRRGFSVSITLAETTKNFLDTVPNYYNYSKEVTRSFISNSQKTENKEIGNIDLIPDLSCIFDIKSIVVASDTDVENMIKNVVDNEESTEENTEENNIINFNGTNNENNISNETSSKTEEKHIYGIINTQSSFVKDIFNKAFDAKKAGNA